MIIAALTKGLYRVTTLKNKNAWVPCRFHQTPRIPWEYRRINNGNKIRSLELW